MYIEGRLVTGATGGKRGDAGHTSGVFALVVDSDADTGKANTATLPPSMQVETSRGNHAHNGDEALHCRHIAL